MRTVSIRSQDVSLRWWVVDAEGLVLGRLASNIAKILQGKTKPEYTPHIDDGDYVVVINADKIRVTGKKLKDKIYYRHSEYPGGIKQRTFTELMEREPCQIIEKAVKGMLPRNKLGRQAYKKLKVYVGSEHPHEAQAPQKIEFSF